MHQLVVRRRKPQIDRHLSRVDLDHSAFPELLNFCIKQSGATIVRTPEPVGRDSSHRGGESFGSELVALMPLLKNYARKLCRSPDSADEIMQSTLLKAWAARSSFSIGTNLNAWVFTILRNEIYTHFRQTAVACRRQCEWTDNMIESVAPAEGFQLSGLTLRDAARALNTALTPHQRDAIIDVFVRNHSYEQVAAIQRCPVGTVKSRVGRGLVRLRGWNKHSDCPGVASPARRRANCSDTIRPPKGKRVIAAKMLKAHAVRYRTMSCAGAERD